MPSPNKDEEQKRKRNQQDMYYAELSYLNNTKQKEVQNENEVKADEREAMDINMLSLENQQKELNAEDQKFKKAMGQNYIREMANKRRKKIKDKLRHINEENFNLERFTKAAAEEQFQTTMTKISLKNDQESVIKERKLRKIKENNIKEQEKREFNN